MHIARFLLPLFVSRYIVDRPFFFLSLCLFPSSSFVLTYSISNWVWFIVAQSMLCLCIDFASTCVMPLCCSMGRASMEFHWLCLFENWSEASRNSNLILAYKFSCKIVWCQMETAVHMAKQPLKIKTNPRKMRKEKQNNTNEEFKKNEFISSIWFWNCRMLATHIIKINAYEWKTHLYLSIAKSPKRREREKNVHRPLRSHDNGSNSKPNLNRSTWLSFPYLGLDDFSSLYSEFFSLICFFLFSFHW